MELSYSGNGPIVVIGGTKDPATPIRWAQEMTTELGANGAHGDLHRRGPRPAAGEQVRHQDRGRRAGRPHAARPTARRATPTRWWPSPTWWGDLPTVPDQQPLDLPAVKAALGPHRHARLRRDPGDLDERHRRPTRRGTTALTDAGFRDAGQPGHRHRRHARTTRGIRHERRPAAGAVHRRRRRSTPTRSGRAPRAACPPARPWCCWPTCRSSPPPSHQATWRTGVTGVDGDAESPPTTFHSSVRNRSACGGCSRLATTTPSIMSAEHGHPRATLELHRHDDTLRVSGASSGPPRRCAAGSESSATTRPRRRASRPSTRAAWAKSSVVWLAGHDG